MIGMHCMGGVCRMARVIGIDVVDTDPAERLWNKALAC